MKKTTIKLSKLSKDNKKNQKDKKKDNQLDNQKDNSLDNDKSGKNKKNKSQKITVFKKDYIESKTKGISKNDVFRKNSIYYKDNELIICMILREKIYSYKCMSSGCQVNHDWNNKPLYLLLNRKNKKRSDLSIDNLEFQCPNCFMQNNGSINWQKEIKEIVIYCQKCNNYPVNNLPDYYKINKICKMCDQKINNVKKTNLASLSILEEACGNSGMITSNIFDFSDMNNKFKSNSKNNYHSLINDDSLDKVIGDYNSNQPYFNINSKPNHMYSNQNNLLSIGNNNGNNSQDSNINDDNDNSDNDDDNDNNANQQNNTINRLSNLDLNSLENINFTDNINISKLTKDIENIADNIDI